MKWSWIQESNPSDGRTKGVSSQRNQREVARPKGFEPSISPWTGERRRPLGYSRLKWSERRESNPSIGRGPTGLSDRRPQPEDLSPSKWCQLPVLGGPVVFRLRE